MFKDNTVFVVGAGASREFGLPIGSGLMSQIKQNSLFRFDSRGLREGVRELYQALDEPNLPHSALRLSLEAMAEINRSIDFAGSIDEFINRHATDPVIAKVGKLQIAYAISIAERQSLLGRSGKSGESVEWDDVKDTWIMSFTQMLFEGVRNEDVSSIGNNITLIVFNYDRCIEYFLTEAICKTFRGVDRDQALQIVENMNIIHPYGALGNLIKHPFGDDAHPTKLNSMSQSIVTWSESVTSNMVSEINRSVSTATTLVFLGFAFAPQNMDLLTIKSAVNKDRQDVETFATAYGYRDVIDSRLKKKIIDLYSDKMTLPR
ncbi:MULTISPECIES: hypothetical protein [unclassified Rhizobium]|uniref:hypothetical protein n=1 Tax=unclassified Rhizobium TaxID=2613769 RepID=UPI00288AA314|nr:MULTISPECIES: hypothetical protein [unclassified Rhizobium]